MGQNSRIPILVPKGKAPNNIKTREELLLVAGKTNGQYQEWVCSWRIEVAAGGLRPPQKPPCCTLWLSVSQLQPAARAQTEARQVRRKTSSKPLSHVGADV